MSTGPIIREGHNHEDVASTNEKSACNDAHILTYTEEHESELRDIKSGLEDTMRDTLNAGEDVSLDSDENGTTCTGVEAYLGDTSAGKAMFKGEMESIVEERSSCVTPGEKVREACDILSCALYGEHGTAANAEAPIRENSDESSFGANKAACRHTV